MSGGSVSDPDDSGSRNTSCNRSRTVTTPTRKELHVLRRSGMFGWFSTPKEEPPLLYLLHPYRPLQWCDMPYGTTDYIKPDTDVSGFGWQPAEERSMTDALVALALR